MKVRSKTVILLPEPWEEHRVGKPTVDHALSSLVTDLLTTIHLLSGYPVVTVQPEIHRLPRPHRGKGLPQTLWRARLYRPDWGVLLDESLNVESDAFDRSDPAARTGSLCASRKRAGSTPCRAHAIAGTRRARGLCLQNQFLADVHSASTWPCLAGSRIATKRFPRSKPPVTIMILPAHDGEPPVTTAVKRLPVKYLSRGG